jgi:DNA-3-methyladenine glycosylase II
MSLTYDADQAIAELTAADPTLGAAIAQLGEFGIEPQPMESPFEALARSIVYQQLSGKAAATILGRVQALFPQGQLKPGLVLDMPPEALRGAGMSRAKVAAFRDLAEKTLDGTVPALEELLAMEDAEIIDHLVQVRGIGPWTVEMLLMFRLGRPDVLPSTDLGIRKGYALVFGLTELPKPSELVERTEHWRPWRTVASWYLWRLVD